MSKKRSKAIFKVKRGNHVYDVGHWGHYAYLAGRPGHGKSTHVTHMAASALKNDWELGYHIDLQDRNIVVIDGEQPPDLYKRSFDRIGEMAGGLNMDRLIYPEESLASIPNVREKKGEMFKILRKNAKDLGVVFIDRVGNFVTNPNDARESDKLHTELLSITEKTNCLMILLCHITPSKWGNTEEVKLFGMQGTQIKASASWGLLAFKQSKYFGLLPDKTRYGSFPPQWAIYKNNGLIPLPYCPF
jgi:hypothetical protein